MSGMRSATIAVLVVLLSGPAWADEGPEHFHYLPPGFYPIEPFIGPTPFPADQRATFDRLLKTMYRKSCNCLMYLENGSVRTKRLPLDDHDRWRLFDRILWGIVIPLNPHDEEI